MNQYVCEGECGGVADEPGTCQSEYCSHYQQPLVEASETDAS